MYFILSPRMKMVKIGRADNPDQRLRDMQTGSADRLEIILRFSARAADEGVYHLRFGDLRKHGEWFSYRGKLREFVEHARSHGHESAVSKLDAEFAVQHGNCDAAIALQETNRRRKLTCAAIEATKKAIRKYEQIEFPSKSVISELEMHRIDLAILEEKLRNQTSTAPPAERPTPSESAYRLGRSRPGV